MKLFTRFVRWATAWAWAQERNVCENVAVLKGIQADEDSMELIIEQSPGVGQWIGHCFASIVASSPNYTEMKFETCGKARGKWEFMTVHIQKLNGKTPHELRMEAERERDELKAQLKLKP